MSTFVCDLCLALSSQGTCLLGDPSHNGWDTITQKPVEGGNTTHKKLNKIVERKKLCFFSLSTTLTRGVNAKSHLETFQVWFGHAAAEDLIRKIKELISRENEKSGGKSTSQNVTLFQHVATFVFTALALQNSSLLF